MTIFSGDLLVFGEVILIETNFTPKSGSYTACPTQKKVNEQLKFYQSHGPFGDTNRV